MLNIVMLNVANNPFMMSVIMLNVDMLSFYLLQLLSHLLPLLLSLLQQLLLLYIISALLLLVLVLFRINNLWKIDKFCCKLASSGLDKRNSLNKQTR